METLLLLHGAIGAADQLQPLAQALSGPYNVHTIDFSGHGGQPFAEEPFSMKLFARDVLSYIEQHNLQRVAIFGYSMGGYVGMYLARHYPEKISKVVTLATKYNWDEAIAAKETQMLVPEKIEQKLPAFAATLSERHAPNDWKEVLRKTADMMIGLGADNVLKGDDYPGIGMPALLLLGDRDKMVTLDETLAVYKALPQSQLGILPGTSHPIEQVDTELLATIVKGFIR